MNWDLASGSRVWAGLSAALRRCPWTSVLIVVIAVAFLGTLRDGHDWGDDFARYIEHAMNISEGRPYNATLRVLNEEYLGGMPPSYPPGYPVALSIVYSFLGLNFTAMKVMTVFFFIAALFVMSRLLSPILTKASVLAVIAIVGTNPWIWDFKENLLSDFLFLLLTYLTLRAMMPHFMGKASRPVSPARGVILAIALAAACSVRSLGLTLPLTAVVHDLFYFRRLRKDLMLVLLLFAVIMALESPWIRGESIRFHYFSLNQWTLAQNFNDLKEGLVLFWRTPYYPILKFQFYVSSVLFLLGLWMRLRKGPTILELFILTYPVPLLMWAFRDRFRFLLPILPLFVFYLCLGGSWVWKTCRTAHLGRVYGTLFLLLTFVGYSLAYARLSMAPIDGPFSPAAKEFFAYIKGHTPSDALIGFELPRALALFGVRPSTNLPYSDTGVLDDAVYFDFIRRARVRYIVGSPNPQLASPEVMNLIRRHPSRFRRDFHNSEFDLFHCQ